MATVAESAPELTLADLVERFGPIPAHRVRVDPPPGTATEEDVVAIRERERRLYELVDGVLVEKAMGRLESERRSTSSPSWGHSSGSDGWASAAAPTI